MYFSVSSPHPHISFFVCLFVHMHLNIFSQYVVFLSLTVHHNVFYHFIKEHKVISNLGICGEYLVHMYKYFYRIHSKKWNFLHQMICIP